MWGPAIVMVFVRLSLCLVQISLKLSEIDVWLLGNSLTFFTFFGWYFMAPRSCLYNYEHDMSSNQIMLQIDIIFQTLIKRSKLSNGKGIMLYRNSFITFLINY